jgi:two-component system response regulator RegX3
VWPSNDEPINVLAVSGAQPELELLVVALHESGFSVDVVNSAAGALTPGRLRRYWVVLADDISAEMDVLALVRGVRQISDIPIIVMTGSALEETIVALLESGADQCVTKPVRPRELVARVRAAVRRASAPRQEPGAIEIDEVVLDPARHLLTVAGREVTLTAKEFALLHFLMANAGQTLSRRQIVERVWDADMTEGTTLDTHIRRIRRKIEDDPSRPARIVTVRKIGYRYQRRQVKPSGTAGS